MNPDASSLRYQIEMSLVNQPDKLLALQTNAMEFGQYLNELPRGTTPEAALFGLGREPWFQNSAMMNQPAPPYQAQQPSYAPPEPPRQWSAPAPVQENPAAYAKRYYGSVIQPPTGPGFLTLQWFLNLAINDLANYNGWQQTQALAGVPGQNGLYFLAAKPYPGGWVQVRFSAIDRGVAPHPHGGMVHVTLIDAYFTDNLAYWPQYASEQAVAEALQLLHYSFCFDDPSRNFWFRAHGGWSCGQNLFPCPDQPI